MLPAESPFQMVVHARRTGNHGNSQVKADSPVLLLNTRNRGADDVEDIVCMFCDVT